MQRLCYTWFLILLLVGVAGCTTTSGAPADVDITSLPDTVSVAAAKALLGRSDVFFLDVREPAEYDAGRIPGVTLIPMGQVPGRLSEIPRDKPVIVTCRTGNRSAQVTRYLRDQGFADVHNMDGGIVAWQKAGHPVDK